MADNQELLIRINGDAKNFFNELDKIKKKTKDLQRGLEAIAKVSAASFAALTTVAVATTIQFAKYEKALVGVAKTTNLSGVALKNFSKDIRDLSKRIPVASTELLGIAQIAGQLGVSGSDNLINFTETIARLAESSDLAGEQGATSLARILEVTGESVENVDELASAIVALGNNFAATESEIVRVATEVGRSTSVFKLSSDQVVAIATALKSLGIQAELGGSATGRAFRAIDKAIREGGKSLDDLSKITGRTIDDLTQSFQVDAVGVFQSFVEGLGAVDSAGGSTTDALAKFGLKGEEILKVLPVLAQRSELLGKALNIAAKEAANATALTEESNKAFGTLSSQVELAKNAISAAAVVVGEQLAPSAIALSKAVARIANNFADLDKDTVKSITTLIKFGIIASGIAGSLAIGGLGIIKFMGLLKALRIAFKASRLAAGAFTAAATGGLSLLLVFLPEAIEAAGGLIKALSDDSPADNIKDVNKVIQKQENLLLKLQDLVDSGNLRDEKSVKKKIKALVDEIDKNRDLKLTIEKLNEERSKEGASKAAENTRVAKFELEKLIKEQEKFNELVKDQSGLERVNSKTRLRSLDIRIKKQQEIIELNKDSVEVTKEEIKFEENKTQSIADTITARIQANKQRVKDETKFNDISEDFQEQDFTNFAKNLNDKSEATRKILEEEDKARDENDKNDKKRKDDAVKEDKSRFDDLNNFLSGGFKGVASTALTSFLGLAGGAGAAFGKVFDILSQDSEDFINTITQLFSTKFLSNISKNIFTFLDEIPKLAGRLVEGVITVLPKITEGLIKVFSDPSFIAEIGLSIVKGFAQGVKNILTGTTETLEDRIAEAEEAQRIQEEKITGFKSEAATLRQKIAKIDADKQNEITRNQLKDAEEIVTSSANQRKEIEKQLQESLTEQAELESDIRIQKIKDDSDEAIETIRNTLGLVNAELSKAEKERARADQTLDSLRAQKAKEVSDAKLAQVEDAISEEQSFLNFANGNLEDLEREASKTRNEIKVEGDQKAKEGLEKSLKETKEEIKSAQKIQSKAQKDFDDALLVAQDTFGVESLKSLDDQIKDAEKVLEDAEIKEQGLRDDKIEAEGKLATAIEKRDTDLAIERKRLANILQGDLLGISNDTIKFLKDVLKIATDEEIKAAGIHNGLLEAEENRKNKEIERLRQQHVDDLAGIVSRIVVLEADKAIVDEADRVELTDEQILTSGTGSLRLGTPDTEQFHNGGLIEGPGRDSRIISARVGEFVVNPVDTARNINSLQSINAGGGPVQRDVDIKVSIEDDAANFITAQQIEDDALGINPT